VNVSRVYHRLSAASVSEITKISLTDINNVLSVQVKSKTAGPDGINIQLGANVERTLQFRYILTSVQFGTFVERSNNVVSERSLWTVIERPRKLCGNFGFQDFATLKGLKRSKLYIALHGKPIKELRSVTCHMGSHSVTCHPTQVNALR